MDKLDLELYEILSDKTISDLCVVEICDRTTLEIWYATISGNVFYYDSDEFLVKDEEAWSDDDYFFKIIGYEPTIQDIFKKCDEWCWNWIANSNNWLAFSEWDCNIWNWIEYDFKKKLINQTDSVKKTIIHYFYQPNEE